MIDIEFQSRASGPTIAVLSGDGESLIGAPAPVAELVDCPLRADRMEGKPGSIVDIRLTSSMDLGGIRIGRVIVVGIGARPDGQAYEKAGAALVRHFSSSGESDLDVFCSASVNDRARLALGATLASYRFDKYRSTLPEEMKPSLRRVRIIGPDVKGAIASYARSAAVADGVAFARDLVSEPPNVLYPEYYADLLASTLEPIGVRVTVLDAGRLGDLGMECLLGVGRGSVRESRVCVMEWNGTDDVQGSPLALIGKGVTFDTGGISIKPAASMDDMKGDMAGSAAVAGAMLAVARRKARAHVVGVVGLVENMPGGKAQRPGDIVVSASGRSVEVLNTDAEGRLVLADLLWYAQKHHKPSAMIDLATLTGAIVISLGNERAGLFCNDDKLAGRLTEAGEAEGELLWRMPLGSAYDRLIDSRVADMKNIGGRGASSITAAQFLGRFVENDMPWAHLDIAGKAWKSGKGDAATPTWATGFGVRLLDRLVGDHYET